MLCMLPTITYMLWKHACYSPALWMLCSGFRNMHVTWIFTCSKPAGHVSQYPSSIPYFLLQKFVMYIKITIIWLVIIISVGRKQLLSKICFVHSLSKTVCECWADLLCLSEWQVLILNMKVLLQISGANATTETKCQCYYSGTSLTDLWNQDTSIFRTLVVVPNAEFAR